MEGIAMATLELCIEGIEPALSVRRFSVREGVSELFDVSVVACSPRADLDLDDVVLKPASFAIAAGWAFVRGGGSRSYSGLCASIEQVHAEPTGLSTYAIRIAPRSWLLTLNRNYRIFQHASIPDIVTRILDERSITHVWRIDRGAHPKLDYKVQYGESDFAFLCRLCEEAGITFTLRVDESGQSILVLDDAPWVAELRGPPVAYVDNPNEAAEQEFVTRVRALREGRAGAAVLRDYDFRNPSLVLAEQASLACPGETLLERCFYEPGSFRVVADTQSATLIADASGVARHDPSYGRGRAERALLGDRAGALQISFETNAMDLAPGTVFSMVGHPHPRLDESRKLLATQLAIEGEHDKEWRTRGSAVFTDQPYLPRRRTIKPVVHGLQSATVTGPKEREIFTDEHGRVRVQFPWDREGRGDEKSSCWIRVSQGWSGAGFGLWTLPRVGQEVLVGFLAGDPDEPIIVGRAPNAHNPAPYSLPAHETKTVWRSRSTPGGEGFNEISFEDKRGEERLYERAERDKESLIKSDERIAVGRNRQKLVKSDEDAAILGTRRELVGGSLHLTIKGERREHVDGSQSFTAGGDRNERVDGRYAIEVGSELHIVAGGSIVLEAPDVTLKASGGFVRVNGGGVVIDGGAVVIKQGGSPGSGAGSSPAVPEAPTIAAAYIPEAPMELRRLPLLALSPIVPMNIGPDVETMVVCQAICNCKDARKISGRNGAQDCVTARLRAYDAALGGQSTIKAEVPYDMTTIPPSPLMSKNHPGPTTGRPAGSKIPDVIVVKDGSRPPTQDNIKKVIEIKFPPDDLTDDQLKEYPKIAGSAPFEVWGPNAPCMCGDEPIKHPLDVPDMDVVTIFLLLAALAILIADDALPGGQADDILIPEVVRRLIERLALLISGMRPVFPAPVVP
jgi:type VI secretion system secreted protein VgrG